MKMNNIEKAINQENRKQNHNKQSCIFIKKQTKQKITKVFFLNKSAFK